MSNNITPEAKKLAVKSELLRHLETAKNMRRNGVQSSEIKVMTLQFDVQMADKGEMPDQKAMDYWNEVMGD